MNKKKLLAVLTAVLAVSGVAGYRISKQDVPADALTLANVEALATTEVLKELCNRYCESNTEYVCYLITNKGTIYCRDMAEKNFGS